LRIACCLAFAFAILENQKVSIGRSAWIIDSFSYRTLHGVLG
jgi:hypothetical protein